MPSLFLVNQEPSILDAILALASEASRVQVVELPVLGLELKTLEVVDVQPKES